MAFRRRNIQSLAVGYLNAGTRHMKELLQLRRYAHCVFVLPLLILASEFESILTGIIQHEQHCA